MSAVMEDETSANSSDFLTRCIEKYHESNSTYSGKNSCNLLLFVQYFFQILADRLQWSFEQLEFFGEIELYYNIGINSKVWRSSLLFWDAYVRGFKTKSALVQDVLQKLTAITKKEFAWVPRHCGMPSNERTDTSAKWTLKMNLLDLS